MCQTLQILVKHRSFIDKQIIFYKIFCISIRNSEIREKLKIWCDKWPPDGIYCQKSLIFTIGGPCFMTIFQFFSYIWFSDKDTEYLWKHHLFVYKRSMLDQNLKGLAQKLGLPRPWQVQNWNGHGGLNFWATTSKFCENA